MKEGRNRAPPDRVSERVSYAHTERGIWADTTCSCALGGMTDYEDTTDPSTRLPVDSMGNTRVYSSCTGKPGCDARREKDQERPEYRRLNERHHHGDTSMALRWDQASCHDDWKRRKSHLN